MMTATTRKRRRMVQSPIEKTFIFPLHSSFSLSTSTSSLPSSTLPISPDRISTVQYHHLTAITTTTTDNNSNGYQIVKQIRDKYYPANCIPVTLEYSIHSCPPSLLRDLKLVFPSLATTCTLNDNLWIIPVFQKTRIDILGNGQEIEDEKARCLELFYLFGLSTCLEARRMGYWADITDPVSGYPMLSECGNSFYPDVPGCERLLGYESVNCGCCSVLNHPRYGTRVYPSTLFISCPLDVLNKHFDI